MSFIFTQAYHLEKMSLLLIRKGESGKGQWTPWVAGYWDKMRQLEFTGQSNEEETGACGEHQGILYSVEYWSEHTRETTTWSWDMSHLKKIEIIAASIHRRLGTMPVPLARQHNLMTHRPKKLNKFQDKKYEENCSEIHHNLMLKTSNKKKLLKNSQ